MRLYPASPARTIARDLAVLLALIVFAWLGVRVHDRVADLAAVGRGIQDSGHAIANAGVQTTRAVDGAFADLAERVNGVPLVGGDLAGALRQVPGGATGPVRETTAEQGARLVVAGREAERKTYRLANLAGWLTFLIPALLLLSRTVPSRVRQVIRISSAERMLRGAPERVLAARAAYTLPYGTLARFTPDPFGDLAAGRHEALLRALAEDAGVAFPPTSGGVRRRPPPPPRTSPSRSRPTA
jgi:hypothetical protein